MSSFKVLESSKCLPKFWIEQDFIDYRKTYFVIEASLPKLIFQENSKGLKNEDLEEVVKAIVNFCRQIGIYIFPIDILNALPTLVAIGKNISITNLCNCDTVLKTLAPFDYKPHAINRMVAFNDYKNNGKELYFNIRGTETTKFYDKKRDILNRAETIKEKELAKELGRNDVVVEILRFERTFKTGKKVGEKFRPLLGGKPATFQNIFNTKIWDALLTEEINLILNHPLKNFIFLSLEEEPFIDAFLRKNFKQIQIRHLVKGFISDLQKNGLATTRKEFLDTFKSRQTWYNYQKRLEQLNKQINTSTLKNLDSHRIHSYILKQFGIDTTHQAKLFDTLLSKKIDV